MSSKPFSNTMRIDLIPDAPGAPRADGQRDVIVAAASPEQQRTVSSDALRADRSASRYKDLLEGIYDGVVITDYDGVIEDVNTRAVDSLQYTAQALMGVSITNLISGATESLIATLLDNLEEDRFTVIQAYCLRGGGSYFPAEIAVSRLEHGDGRLCFFVRDITWRRQAEEMLRTEHNALQNARAGIGIVNRGLEIEYGNPALAAMCGYPSPKALMGVDLRKLVRADDNIHANFEAALDGSGGWEGNALLNTSGEADLAVRVAVTPNRNTDGEIVGLVLSFVDLSDQQRAEEAMREAERRRVMIESLGAACHHLGQPATVLTANLGLIRNRLGSDESMTVQLVENSLEACDKLADILRKMNAVADYRTVEYLPADAHERGGDRIVDF